MMIIKKRSRLLTYKMAKQSLASKLFDLLEQTFVGYCLVVQADLSSQIL